MNFHNVYLVFPMKIKKSSSVANDLADDVITVNNFFGHWIKELNIKRYGDDIPILPLTNTVLIQIYKYSDVMLKHIEDDGLKSFQNDLLYSNKKVSLSTGEDRRKHSRPKLLTWLREQMTTLTIDLTNFLINFRMNIIT